MPRRSPSCQLVLMERASRTRSTFGVSKESIVLIGETLIVLVLLDVAAGIEMSSDRQSGEWTSLYWLQLTAAAGAVAYGVFALWANRQLVEDLALFLPPLVVYLFLLLPASALLMTYAATFTLGYWTYRSAG
jgi:hypothetical protein